ncbi:MAG: type II secretion system protein [Candidatus Moranbacteria bacterium]|nr:type II secretion system protein [Candidatus Moranbacteria bacterium]
MKTFRKDNRGMSLVEMITVSVILVLVSGAIAVALGKTFFVNKYTIEQGLNNNALQAAVNNFSKHAREARQSDSGGYLIKEAGDFDLIFFADLDDDGITEKARYFLEDQQLKLGISEPSGFPLQYPENDQETKVIARGIVNSSQDPIFYYYNSDYPADTENNPLSTPAPVEDVSLIRIYVQANIDPDHSPDSMEIETFVRPRNIKSD